ncbi:hypothetical protein FIV42_01840 [Persicimonas caeni]|uniref:Receptor L-domain domain-containing protein n=1 Tax=Persicimonas caeni TaxID=2292766 RepID=A0A4Y6PMN7_PERCE|nr:hypothetical protein [Persicimonas caeni]QDG49520.1 hypothetical protein FIV42_01840 [Persicimonas caeni]QED30741.1 hypothetical protein FRD00_01835 [Persicimonas caeni]
MMRRTASVFALAALVCACGDLGHKDVPSDGPGAGSGTTQGDCAEARIDGSFVLPDDAGALRSQMDAERANCVTIVGNLFVDRGFQGIRLLEAPNQIHVLGDVRVGGTDLEDLSGLSGLAEVNGDLVVEQNDRLRTDAGLDSVARIGGDYHVVGNASLVAVQGPANLSQVAGDIHIERNGALETIAGFDRLQLLADYRGPSARPQASGIADEPPESRGGDGPIDPHLIVDDNASLEEIRGFRRLTDIDGDIRLTNNPKLSRVAGFESLEFMTGALEVRNSPQLTDVTALTRVSCLAEVVLENTGLADLGSFRDLYELGRVELRDNPKLQSLAGLREQVAVRGPVRVTDNPALTDVAQLWGIETLGQDSLGFDAELPDDYEDTPNYLCSPTIPDETYGHLHVEGNDALQSLGDTPVRRINGDLLVRGNDALTTIDGFTQLAVLDGEVRIEDNAKLASIDGFDDLARLPRGLVVQNNPRLTALDGFANVRRLGEITVDAVIHIGFNPKLSRIDALGALATVEGGIELRENPALERFTGMNRVERLGWLTVEGNGLSRIDFAAGLKFVDGDLTVSSNERLQTMDGLGALSNVDGHLRIETNATLTDLRGLSNLLSVDQGLYVRDNASLPGCEVAWLEESVESVSYVVAENNASSCEE